MKTLKSLIIAIAALVMIMVVPYAAQAGENVDNVSLDEVASIIKDMVQKADGTGSDGIKTIKKNAVTFCMIGEEYEKEGKYVEALVYFELALKLDPEYKRAQKGINKINALSVAMK